MLQYAPGYWQNPLPGYLIYSVSQSLSIRTSIIRMITGINTQ